VLVTRRRLLLGPLLALLLVLPAPAGAISTTELQSALSAQMRHAGGASAAYVIALDGDQPLYALRPDRTLIPASVNKLFVTATALLRYGPEVRLDTSVLTTGEIDADGVLHGNLYLRGGGDPTLTTTRLAELAAEIGLTEVDGAVIGDDSVFDDLRGSANTGGGRDSEIGGQLAGLVANRGYAGRGWQGRPAAVAADALLRALEKRGIDVARKARIGQTPEDAVELAKTQSAPMSELIQRTNTPSDNFYAEMLLKDLGASFGEGGSTDAGARVVRDQMSELDVRPTVVDGSGLSRSDRTNARQVVLLLANMAGGDHAQPFLDSLSVVGRTGTLANRMRRTRAAGRCRGKTGTLRDVSNVVGVCQTQAGAVAFAFLMNSVSPWSAHTLQDRMVSAVARLTVQ
jgi:D-alanyl-D-alanine carboxypeptidase/D-alanyl-D-alanine-endopeptidase (penicillin-binding protein 4)